MILHFVDVLMSKMTQCESKPLPEVRIKSSLFNEVPNDMIDALFQDLYGNNEAAFTDEERWFVLRNADIYYFIYGYWHNYANKPICLKIDTISGMRRSKVLQSNDIHIRHQEAKFNELKRRCQGDHVKGLYLVN